MSISSFHLQSLKAVGKCILKAEKEKVAKSFELLNLLLKTVTEEVSAGPDVCKWLLF